MYIWKRPDIISFSSQLLTCIYSIILNKIVALLLDIKIKYSGLQKYFKPNHTKTNIMTIGQGKVCTGL